MLTQIYEVSDPDEATAISNTGVDHIGVLIGDGEFPREQTIEVAQRIAAAIHPPSKFSALFLTHNTTLIERWARKLRPHIVVSEQRLISFSRHTLPSSRASSPALSS